MKKSTQLEISIITAVSCFIGSLLFCAWFCFKSFLFDLQQLFSEAWQYRVCVSLVTAFIVWEIVWMVRFICFPDDTNKNQETEE